MKGIKDMAKLVFNYGAMGSSKTIMHLWLHIITIITKNRAARSDFKTGY